MDPTIGSDKAEPVCLGFRINRVEKGVITVVLPVGLRNRPRLYASAAQKGGDGMSGNPDSFTHGFFYPFATTAFYASPLQEVVDGLFRGLIPLKSVPIRRHFVVRTAGGMA